MVFDDTITDRGGIVEEGTNPSHQVIELTGQFVVILG